MGKMITVSDSNYFIWSWKLIVQIKVKLIPDDDGSIKIENNQMPINGTSIDTGNTVNDNGNNNGNEQ